MVFISSFASRPRIPFYPRTGYWAIGPALSNANSIYGIIWPPQKLYVVGVDNQRESGVRIMLVSPKRITIEKSMRLGFSETSNEAEYEALLIGVAMVKKLGGKAVDIFSNSRLVID